MDALKAQDALMSGQARFEKWFASFMEGWQKPMQKQQLMAYWAILPAEAKDKLKEQDPDGFEKLEKFLNSSS